jgi:hypothetical protein
MDKYEPTALGVPLKLLSPEKTSSRNVSDRLLGCRL